MDSSTNMKMEDIKKIIPLKKEDIFSSFRGNVLTRKRTMAKQVIEIECPDGMKAVWKDNKVEFVPLNPLELIKDVEDAENVVGDALGTDFYDIDDVINDLNLGKFIELQTVLKALNGPDFKWNLIKGTVWYPWVRFIRENKVKDRIYSDEKVIGHFKYEGTRYALVGGCAYYGGAAGLGTFLSSDGVGLAHVAIGFLSCKDEATAHYVSEHFGKLVFEAVTAFKLEGIEWLD